MSLELFPLIEEIGAFERCRPCMIGKLFILYLDSINNLHKLCRTFSASALDYSTLF